jgi:cell wall-associated NlpC family hydrolase
MSSAKIAIAAAVAVLLPVVLIAAMAGGIAEMFLGDSTSDCTLGSSATAEVAGYGPAQMANAATIVAVGKQLNVPEQGWVVAVAAAMQESGLNNLNHGDRDSLGLFQERPSQGWGSPAQIMDPTYSATQFYQHLLAIPGWQQFSVNDAAQAVERSGFPDAYAQHEQAARDVVNAVQGVACTTGTLPNTLALCAVTQSTPQSGAPEPSRSPALVAVEFACAQLGKPYVWGGNGDPGFDCSGLTHAAYAAAGIAIPRTAQSQYDAGPLLATGTPLQPGDLVFYGDGPRSVIHVGIAISPTQMIDAPHSGADVETVGDGRYLAASRPTVTTAT